MESPLLKTLAAGATAPHMIWPFSELPTRTQQELALSILTLMYAAGIIFYSFTTVVLCSIMLPASIASASVLWLKLPPSSAGVYILAMVVFGAQAVLLIWRAIMYLIGTVSAVSDLVMGDVRLDDYEGTVPDDTSDDLPPLTCLWLVFITFMSILAAESARALFAFVNAAHTAAEAGPTRPEATAAAEDPEAASLVGTAGGTAAAGVAVHEPVLGVPLPAPLGQAVDDERPPTAFLRAYIELGRGRAEPWLRREGGDKSLSEDGGLAAGSASRSVSSTGAAVTDRMARCSSGGEGPTPGAVAGSGASELAGPLEGEGARGEEDAPASAVREQQEPLLSRSPGTRQSVASG
ncbi:hypothetical protein HYH03_018087 [Edaphochlamys debaryana]|uniref:Uncharacterized protein n=1 Tax=Edaphochlamys debaryana TaxID=47281 RepID=A0A835XH58_9CHLO|nr:hypothetical protein HYH03_018087 [Edaphochlamys debaryana]|eukprot:KAG2483007.1 hypothetical protein HYH03_018087 [Edaphochlamys debaryana]